MKLTHIDNACCIYEVNGFKLLADPWLTDGAFEGSWYHYPPLMTTYDTIKDCDALYISHLHPDHYDETVLRQFVADKPALPVVVLDHGSNFLHRKLEALGFTNLVKVKDKETISIGPLEVTVYAPFVKHPFDNSVLGNFIDSAIVVESNGKVILNANDNTPDAASARDLFVRHGSFTVAQLKDALAGAYPSCFFNLHNDEKLSEAKRLILRQLTAMCEVAHILKAEWFQPFAGDYQLAGSLVKKNKYLGVPAKRFSAEVIASHGLRPLVLSEQGSINLINGDLSVSYRKNIEPYEKWSERVSQNKFRWENDPEPDKQELFELMKKARANLWKKQVQLNFFPNYKMIVIASNASICFNFNEENITGYVYDQDMRAHLDPKLLKRILTRKVHWNNAEVGCHIEFHRNRDGKYNPDVHMIMSFFHG